MKKRPQLIQEILPGLLKKLEAVRRDTDFIDDIKDNWAKAIQNSVGYHSRPLSVSKDGVLIVEVESPAWAYKASMEKKSILNALKKAIPGARAISSIEFKHHS
jgi:predicted nucleic acid-binding Zn ribbon protein